MSGPAGCPECILLHRVHDSRPRLGLGYSNRDEPRAWYKRWTWFHASTWTTPAKHPGVDRKSTTPSSRSHSPNLAEQSSKNIIPHPNSMTAQFSDWTASQLAAEGSGDDGKPTTPQHPLDFIIGKEMRRSSHSSSCASSQDMASGFHEGANKDEVKSPDIQYSFPIPSTDKDPHIFDLNSDSHRSATQPDRGIASTEYHRHSNLQWQVIVDGEKDLRRPSSLSSSTSSDSSELYKYTPDKSNLDPDSLNPDHPSISDVLTNTNYPERDATDTSPEYAANDRNSSAYPFSEQGPKTNRLRSFVLSERGPFFSPKSCVLSESSQGSVATPRSSNSSDSIRTEPRQMRQPQVVSALQEGSVLNFVINTLVDEAKIDYDSSFLDDVDTLAEKPYVKTSSNSSSSRTTEELENQFVTLVNTKNILLLRHMAVATDIGIALELLMPKLRIYVKDEATLARVYEDIRSIKQECLDRQLDIHFFALEFLSPTVSPPHTPPLQQKIEALQRKLQPIFDKYQASRDAALRFIVDPRALIENRLGIFSTSQR